MPVSYLVIPFHRGARGRIGAGQAQSFKILDKAMTYGERMAAERVGALVLEADPKPDDEFATPKLIAKLGDVPDEAVEALAA